MAQLSSYDTPTRRGYLYGELHAYERRWWRHWRRRCDVCGKQRCEWADRHETAQRELERFARSA